LIFLLPPHYAMIRALMLLMPDLLLLLHCLIFAFICRVYFITLYAAFFSERQRYIRV